jgi:hypothetical protein
VTILIKAPVQRHQRLPAPPPGVDHRRRLVLAAPLAATLALSAGCVQMTRMGPGEVVIRDRMTATLQSPWNRFDSPASGRAEVWTTDGLTLDRIEFFVAIAADEMLATPPSGATKSVPRFRPTMQPQEIVEMVDATFAMHGGVFRLEQLAPARFAGGEGFRFEFTQIRKSDELTLRGIGYGTIRQNLLYLVLFQAPRLHYFPRNVKRFEEVVSSIQIRR